MGLFYHFFYHEFINCLPISQNFAIIQFLYGRVRFDYACVVTIQTGRERSNPRLWTEKDLLACKRWRFGCEMKIRAGFVKKRERTGRILRRGEIWILPHMLLFFVRVKKSNNIFALRCRLLVGYWCVHPDCFAAISKTVRLSILVQKNKRKIMRPFFNM